MKLSLEASVRSGMRLTETITLNHGGNEYVFGTSEEGLFNKIRITAPVSDPSKFGLQIGSSRGSPLVLRADTTLIERLRQEMQDFEGIFALAFNLTSIGWETAKRETLPESDDEAERAAFSYQRTRRIPGSDPINVSREAIVGFVQRRERYASLRVPLAFWREGNNELRSFRFINSFFNFYFVIEGLFANGKTATVEVRKQFQRSVELQKTIANILPAHLDVGRIPNPLARLLAEIGEEQTVEGVMSMLVTLRGQLHHYSHASTRRQGNPLNQEFFDSAAFLSGHIATNVLRARLSEIDRVKTAEGQPPYGGEV